MVEVERFRISTTEVDDVLSAFRDIRVGAKRRASLAKVASWAVWSDDISAPTEALLRREGITTSFILVGANWGGDGKESVLLKELDWANFHTDPTKTRGPYPHRKIRRAIAGEPDGSPPIVELRGAYMTDVVKRVSTKSAGHLPKVLRERECESRRCAEELAAELTVCRKYNGGSPPLILAFGVVAYRLLVGGRWNAQQGDSCALADAVQAVLGESAEPCVRYVRHCAHSGGPDVVHSSLRWALQRGDDDEPDFVVDAADRRRLRELTRGIP